jgi:hypothetical protein
MGIFPWIGLTRLKSASNAMNSRTNAKDINAQMQLDRLISKNFRDTFIW